MLEFTLLHDARGPAVVLITMQMSSFKAMRTVKACLADTACKLARIGWAKQSTRMCLAGGFWQDQQSHGTF